MFMLWCPLWRVSLAFECRSLPIRRSSSSTQPTPAATSCVCSSRRPRAGHEADPPSAPVDRDPILPYLAVAHDNLEPLEVQVLRLQACALHQPEPSAAMSAGTPVIRSSTSATSISANTAGPRCARPLRPRELPQSGEGWRARERRGKAGPRGSRFCVEALTCCVLVRCERNASISEGCPARARTP